ncbi:DUF5677 domain-containing protein [Sphingomonas sp. AOB5]|uniref:DUF5677 domain-containing protein n=1 Tax=Sphingomonas sp. AOB5 TaxID=3034017 RepID=UPI0023F86331|nr:DUF5677 domain-containing protein [Sphingomonas sp. AOB5]MDF7774264.1 DUF5677 domain-containing protein [Sphingomonas sp. AOB5]
MGALQDSLDRFLDELPRRELEHLVQDKLQAAGVEDEALLGKIVDALLEGGGKIASILHDRPIKIEFDDADFERLGKLSTRLEEQLPEIFERVADRSANDIAEAMREKWRTGPADNQAEVTRSRILKTWAEPFDALRMLLTLCAEEGDKFNHAHLSSRRAGEEGQALALARLHIRACRIAEEILLLLEHGRTEGAQARWRTLHEVAITATLIAEGGDALARRYFDHEIVDRKKALDDHRRAAELDGGSSADRDYAIELEKDFARAVAKYGRHFRGMYGWAGGQLGVPDDPKFHHLQEAAGSLTLKHRYRLASFDNHASPRALSQPMHLWDPTTHIPSVFEAGFEAPATDTAQALVQITTTLYPQPWELDEIVFVKVLGRLRDDTAAAWFRVARQIARREQQDIDRAVRRSASRRMGYVKAKPGKRRI